jgi:hypothetical protein
MVTAPARDKGFKPECSAVGYFMNLLQQIGSHLSARRSTESARDFYFSSVGRCVSRLGETR